MILEIFTTIHYDLNGMSNAAVGEFLHTLLRDGNEWAEESKEIDPESEVPIMGTLTVDHVQKQMFWHPTAITPHEFLKLVAAITGGTLQEAKDLALMEPEGHA